jgi:hypothetical protein
LLDNEIVISIACTVRLLSLGQRLISQQLLMLMLMLYLNLSTELVNQTLLKVHQSHHLPVPTLRLSV